MSNDHLRDDIDAAVTRCMDQGWTAELLLHVFRGDRHGAAQVLATVLDGRPLDDGHCGAYVLARLRVLGPLPGGAAVGDDDGGLDAKIVDRVRGLLAKAESTTFEAEADACTAKAQELITKHAIDLAVLQGKTSNPGTVGVRHVTLFEPYLKPKFLLLSRVAAANGCRSLLLTHAGIATVFGLAPDLAAVELLFTSLLAQATSSMLQAGKGQRAASTRSFRHSFLLAYAARIGERLDEATAAATREASDEHADLLPVLRDRAQAVDQALHEACPSARSLKVTWSNVDGVAAGRDAADRASLGGPTLPGRRPGLPAA